MSRLPHVTSVNQGGVHLDPIVQVPIGPHMVTFSDLGVVTVHHADGINVGSIEVDDGDPRMMIQIIMAGCQCGCAKPGTALMVTPSIEHARGIAQQLVRQADAAEAAAKAAAAQLLNKVSGK